MSANEKVSEVENAAPKRRGCLAFFRSEILIGSLVALLSILTALIGYRSSEVESMSDDLNLSAQRTLSEANREYLDAGQIVVQDFLSYDSWFAATNNEAEENYVSSFSNALFENFNDPERTVFDELYFEELFNEAGLLDPGQRFMLDIISYDNYYASTNISAADNFYGSFSEALIDNLEGEGRDTIFDEIYYDDMYSLSSTCFVESDTLFIQGQQVGGIADQYQLVMFIFAIGLAMSAWASLLGETGIMRLLFVFFALAMLLFGTLIYFGVQTEASEVLNLVAETSCLDALSGGQ